MLPAPSRATHRVLYARKSTDRDDKQMLSIPAQIEEMHARAARQGLVIAEDRTEHFSAREPGRPVFSQLLVDIESGKVDGIVCWTLDRLARNPVDGGRLVHLLGKGLLKEIVTHDAVYTGNGDTKFMLQVLFGAATKMTDDLVIGVKRGNRAVHERGRITGLPALGYMKHRDTGFQRGAAPVVPDPERFDLVRQIWDDMLTGVVTVAEATRRAAERGLTTRASRVRTSAPIASGAVHVLLRNPFYAGTVVRCGEFYAGEHEPMVTQDEFDRVQEILRRHGTPRRRTHSFLYAGLLRCGHCGDQLLVGEKAKGRSRYYTYYRCHRKEHGRVACRAPAPSEDQVTADIEAYLEKVTLPPHVREWTLSAIDWYYDREGGRAAEMAETARTGIRNAERRLANLTGLVIDGIIDRDEFTVQRGALHHELGRLRRTVESPTAELDDWREKAIRLVTLGSELVTRFRDGADDEKRRLLGVISLNHVVMDRKTTPVLRFPYSLLEDAPRGPASRRPPGLNHLEQPRSSTPTTKTARSRSRNARGYHSWWTLLLGIRTQSTYLGDDVESLESPKPEQQPSAWAPPLDQAA